MKHKKGKLLRRKRKSTEKKDLKINDNGAENEPEDYVEQNDDVTEEIDYQSGDDEEQSMDETLNDDDADDGQSFSGEDPEKKQRKSGVVYIQTVPPQFTVSKMRDVLSKFGEVGRIFLQPEKEMVRGKRRKRYVEGWVEFRRKRQAKRVAEMLNGQPVGGKRRSAAFDTLWSMKYLSGFKWIHLIEQLTYERRVDAHRMRAEISQAKRRAEHFTEQVEKGARIKRLEEKMLKKRGLWERYQRQIHQRRVIDEEKLAKSQAVNESDDFLRMIFDKKSGDG